MIFEQELGERGREALVGQPLDLEDDGAAWRKCPHFVADLDLMAGAHLLVVDAHVSGVASGLRQCA